MQIFLLTQFLMSTYKFGVDFFQRLYVKGARIQLWRIFFSKIVHEMVSHTNLNQISPKDCTQEGPVYKVRADLTCRLCVRLSRGLALF